MSPGKNNPQHSLMPWNIEADDGLFLAGSHRTPRGAHHFCKIGTDADRNRQHRKGGIANP